MITKKIKYLSLFIMMLLISTNTVLANTNDLIIDFEKLGTATVTLKDKVDEEAIEGAEITIQMVAHATSNNSNLVFTYHESITTCEADLSNLKESNLANQINSCITEEIELPKQTKLTNEEGTVKFDNLELGLYLVTQTNKVKGYSNIDPFLIMVPIEQDNKWIYDIKATPKTDIIRLFDITVEKKWDSVNSESTPEYVTIQLLKGEKIVDTIKLSKENNWTYTWVQIEKSDEYKVLEINIPAGYTATYREVGNNFIVTNTKTLVQTGTNIIVIELLAGLGIFLVVVGIICEKRKNYE